MILCSRSRLTTTFSKSFDIYGRFETGLKLLSSSQSADGFLRIGVTMADLSVGGTYESWRDELINAVIMGAS